jgi:hypothetical protein
VRHRGRFTLTLLLVPVWLGIAHAVVAAQPFPSDSGVLNVRDFGAKGNGQDDDTAALLAAIAAAGTDTGAFFWRTRIVYLPAGTYLVSRSLVKRYADQRFGSGMILIGQSVSDTVIKLADRAPAFGDAASPRGVIMTSAKLLDGDATSGGKDYTNKGEGNDAYENFIEDVTIDVGHGNPGAIGIDYLANNIGAIRDVHVIAPSDSGAIGIALQRKWPGPALLQRVSVNGFEVGIAVVNTEYGVTLDHIRLSAQRRVGLANDGNAIAAADLTILTAGTAIANTAPGGLVVLTGSILRRGSEDAEALLNHGTITAYGLLLEGFRSPGGSPAPTFGTLQGEQWRQQPPRPDVTLVDAPPVTAEPTSRWVNVLRGGGAGGDGQDITDALRQSMASGAATIYLPYGRYMISDAITIPPTLLRIVGMNASITVRPERNSNFARDHGMFRIEQPGPPLTIERLAFDMTDLGDQLAVEVTAQRDVTLRDTVTAGTSLLDRGPDGGRIFVEDTCCGSLHLAGPQPVYARQLDTEGGGTRIVNEGSPLTILGLKTEGDCTVLDNRDGARSLILGGLLYIVRDAEARVPAFRNSNASLQASFVEESLRLGSHYTTYLQDSDARRQIRAASFPSRGFGRIVPWLTTGH